MGVATIKKIKNKTGLIGAVIEKPKKPKYSKTWLAMLANKGTGTIVDIRAVLK